MQCPNCKGQKVFRDRRCLCKEFSRTEDCQRCGGKGTIDSPCPVCKARGTIPDIYRFLFFNDESGQHEELVINTHMSLPIALRKVVQQFPTAKQPFQETRLSIDMSTMFREMCARLGISEKTHVMYYNRHILGFGWHFSNHHIVTYRSAIGEKPIELSPQDFLQKMQDAIGRAFAFLEQDSELDAYVYRFRKRTPTDQLLDDLYTLVSSHGYSYSLRVFEGNIGTGESGWMVLLTSPEGGHLKELACDYFFSEALHAAYDAACTFFKEE